MRLLWLSIFPEGRVPAAPMSPGIAKVITSPENVRVTEPWFYLASGLLNQGLWLLQSEWG